MFANQRFVDIAAGKVIDHAERRVLENSVDGNTKEPFKLRQIRVGLRDPANGVRYTARLTVPGGLIVGESDIPFRFNIETSVALEFTTDIANNVNQQIMLTMHDLPDSPNIYGATYFVKDASSKDLPLPQGLTLIPPWVVAVTAYGGGIITFIDSTFNTIATMQSVQMIPRPRAAEFLTSDAETHAGVLFHY